MLECGAYTFDPAGIAHRRSQARMGSWSDLASVTVRVLPPRWQPAYEIAFEFVTGHEVRFAPPPNLLGRPRATLIAEVLRLAAQHAPATADFSRRARQLMTWGQVDDLERTQIEATGASELSVDRLIRAAHWRWARLQYRRARALATAATRRDVTHPEPWQLLLAMAAEQGRSPESISDLSTEVLARSVHDRDARRLQVLAALAATKSRTHADQRTPPIIDAETAARAWLREQPDDSTVGLALVDHLARRGDFAACLPLLEALLAHPRPPAIRDELATRLEQFRRLAADPGLQRRHRRRATWQRVGIAAAVVLWVGLVFAGFQLRRWQYEKQQERMEHARAQLDRMRRANEESRKLLLQTPLERARREAEGGDVEAMMRVALYLDHGLLGATKDPKEAHAWKLRAANADHLPAMVSVGRSLLRGEGVPRDVTAAQRWFEKAAELDHAPAATALGDLFYGGRDVPQDYALALYWYKQGADGGDTRAKGQLGYHYERGLGTARDPKAAYAIYRAMAEGGNAWAANKVGVMHARGDGVELDPVEAAKWYRVGAEKNHATAQSNLALALSAGRGVERDPAEAIRWLEKAVAQKHAPAVVTLGQFHLHGVSVPKDEVRGAALIRQAAEELKDQGAQLTYAHLLWNGTGVATDRAAARARVDELIRQGFAPARLALAEFALAGGGAADFAQARVLLQEAGAKGDTFGVIRHALMCLEGLGGPRDVAAAMRLLRPAADRGDPMAALFLAGALARGDEATGVAADPAEARRWLQAAAASRSGPAAAYLRRLDEGVELADLLSGRVSDQSPRTSPPPAPAETDLPAERLPVPVFQARPIYPLSLRYLKLGGEVVVDFVVSTEGRVVGAKAARSSLPHFEAAAVAAVERWRFKPAVKGHQFVDTHMQVPVVFSLSGEAVSDSAPARPVEGR